VKIRQRLALRFTLVSALVMGAILVFIFILTRGFVSADFGQRLTQQSRLEVIHYATPTVRDVTPPSSFFLVNPVVSIYSDSGELLYQKGNYSIPDTWLTFMKDNSMFNAERGEYTTVGRKYDIAGKRYIVFVSDNDLPGQHELDILLKAIILGYVVSLMLSYGAGLYFSGKALQPVKHVIHEVRQINHDNLSHRLNLAKEDATHDEIDELVMTFNALLNRIESAFRTQKRFVQNASHELKTPLTAIMAEAELALARERNVDEYKRTLHVVMLETERLVRITQGLLTLARVEEGNDQSEMELVDVSQLIASVVTLFERHYPERKMTVAGQANDVQVQGNVQLLQAAIVNVIDNAVKYSDGGITMTIHGDMKQISIGIQDQGIGIPAHELNRIRSPLFRGSNVGDIQGAGLGLSLVERIVKIHGGKLNIFSEEGKGTHCVIVLPVKLFSGRAYG
jgi:signal transduction histidine kinase